MTGDEIKHDNLICTAGVLTVKPWTMRGKFWIVRNSGPAWPKYASARTRRCFEGFLRGFRHIWAFLRRSCLRKYLLTYIHCVSANLQPLFSFQQTQKSKRDGEEEGRCWSRWATPPLHVPALFPQRSSMDRIRSNGVQLQEKTIKTSHKKSLWSINIDVIEACYFNKTLYCCWKAPHKHYISTFRNELEKN